MTTTSDELHRLGRALRESGYEFTTVTPATHARVNRRPDNTEARDLRGVFGWSRPFRPETVPGEILDMLRAADAVESHGSLWRSKIRFSSYGGELFVHSAFPTDAADAVFFGPDTYRMADAAVAHVGSRSEPPARVADVGCGSGAGAVAVARSAPHAQVVAVDINPAALRFTEVNARLAGTANVSPQYSDLLDAVDGDFDLIIANPPFMIDPAGRTYRDGGGPDGNDLPLSLIDTAAKRLTPGGALVLFAGTGIVDGRDPLRAAAAERLHGTGLTWTYREVDPDVYGEELDGPAYAHADRIAVVLLTATRPR
ncbi:class I SAM-dependent methyltransferase [Actinoplanes sichuanensis]|uniref:Class I SAM-dependent methyltransferase n=1 Tax=Actinoplanes sichuanensis TaxID=512349 RepID=A0ABW4A972_9ACTN|nr:class I SAM-dependent methyltransferase [Actinoplanes sichuanensis]